MKHTLNLLLMAFLIVTLPGCWWRKKASCKNRCSNRTATITMPRDENRSIIANNEPVQGFFETEGEDFDMIDHDSFNQISVSQDSDVVHDDFSWINAQPSQENNFKTVYFDFDDHAVRADQRSLVATDAQLAEKTLSHAPEKAIVVEGHACHSAGSRTYNIALSEKRAQAVATELVAEGVDAQHIKTVGRGSEMPAIVSGKYVEGNRQQQWPNRRVEIHATNA